MPEAAAQRLLQHFRDHAPARFPAGATHDQTPALLAALAPEACARTRAAAEGILRGRFDLLGYPGLSFGTPVDWQLDPVSGRRSPLVHWSAIDPTDAPALGDSKVVWELSRQQFLVTLGIAYRTSGDERYAEAFAGLVQAWLHANPAGQGINWASSLEVALRLVAWCWALVLFRSSPHLTPALFAQIHAAVGSHAAHIERYLSRHFSPNTHLTGEALGLFHAGVLFPESRRAARFRGLGQRILLQQIERQVLADGVYFEQTTAYQRYSVEIYLHFLMLASRNRIPVSDSVAERVQRMLDVLLSLRRPDGGMPSIGDSDGGCLLPLVPRPPDDLRGVFALAAACFGRADYAWAAGGLQPEALWFLGPPAVAAFEQCGAAPPEQASRVFADGGYVVMRSGWQRDSHHLVFDVGPLGCPVSGGHGHADLLSVQVSPFGDPFVVDPGTYAYAADPALRAHFRSTRAHATVCVDGQGQAEPRAAFTWRERPSARLRNFQSTPLFDLADASHDAYQRLPDPVRHRRRVLFVKAPGYFVILDDLEGADEHRIELRFQFAPLDVSSTADGWTTAVGPHGQGLLLRTFARPALSNRIARGEASPYEGWVSRDYGQREPAPVLICALTGRLPASLLTVLLPTLDVTAAPPRVAPVLDSAGSPCGLRFEDGSQTIRFDEAALTIEGP